MKKAYMKPTLRVIEMRHMTRILAESVDVRGVQSSGWNNPADNLNLNQQGGGSSIWDR